MHVYHSGAHVTVDAHLLAGHRIEGEAGTDFRHPLRALGDHQELDDGDDEEDDDPHHQIAPHHEVAEGVDDLASIGLQQDHPGGAHREREPEQSGDQQHRRKGGELQGGVDVDRHHQQHH
ncbi:hypothetical protein D3C79_457120 [compost metagenome]